jgi:hypothetical protein
MSEPGGQGRDRLAVDVPVALAEELAALGVAQDHAAAAGGQEHPGADLAGEGPGLLPVHVLGAQGDAAAAQLAADGLQGGEGRADGHVRAVGAGEQREQLAGQGRALLGSLLHLPVPGDEDPAHG